MTDETKMSDIVAEQIKATGKIIGTMLTTRAYYEHDGVDTTAYDADIEKLKGQLKTMVKLQRTYAEREKND